MTRHNLDGRSSLGRLDHDMSAENSAEFTAVNGGVEYRGFVITYDPPPIPTRAYDWRWVAEDYDSAPDSPDDRSGASASLDAAKADVDAWWDDYENGDSQLRFETETGGSYDDSQALASAGMIEEP